MKTPITKEIIKNHWGYSSWKYILLIVCAIFGWNLLYTTTAYRPPEEKKVNIIATCTGEQELLDAYMENIRLTEMSDMEEMSSYLMYMDEMYGSMQLSTYIGAGEGNIYILNKDEFQAYAAAGAFIPLDQVDGMLAYIEECGFDVEKGWRLETELNEKHLYGIPLTNLPGLRQYLYAFDERYVAIIVNNANDENSLKFLKILMRDMQEVAPAEEPADAAATAEPQTAE